MPFKPKHPLLCRASKLARRCRVGVFSATLLPGLTFAANVSVNVTSNLFTVASTAYGMHTSVYDNQNGNANLSSRLIESGVNTVRYSGGGYADVFHWSVNKLSPWQDGSYGYQGPNTDFGHFVGLLDNAHAQAVITVNFGSGQLWNAGHTQLMAPSTNAEPPEAAAWVAYANANTNIFGTTNDITLGTDSQGNNWRTAGFWAKLRSSTPAAYQTWATAAGVYDVTFSFLAINHPAPVGIKYWEIGNETFGTGYYDGSDGYSVDYAVPYDGTERFDNTNLSPAFYGRQVNAFSQMMKAVDPTIKIGAAVSTPPGDYSWDNMGGQRWTPQVLAQCASNVDFVIAHWYPFAGNNANGSSLLSQVGSTIPFMINGQTAGLDSETSSGLRDWINDYRSDGTNVQIFITEFGYMGNVTNSINGTPIIGPVTALFDVDSYATWMSYGVSNICFLEMNKTPFLGDSSSLTRGETFYAIKLLHQMAVPGDMFVNSTSDTANLRVQATRQQSGQVGLMLLNENRTANQTVNVTISNAALSPLGTKYQFGTNNFTGTQETPTSPPSTNSFFGLGNSFSLTVPAYTMVVLTIPTVGNTPTTVGLASSVNPSAYGSPVTFTATVRTNGVALGGIAGDTVTFLNGTVPLGTITMNAGGQATFITSATQLPAGADSITAVYDGDPVYSPSTNSPALSQTVNQATLTAGLTGTVSKNYNGTMAATLAAGNYTLSGVLSGDTVTLNNPTSGTYDTRNQGTGKTVTVTGLAISGSSSANYSLANTSILAAVGTINKTNITVTAVANTKFYDATLGAAATPIVTSGAVQTGDTANFTESYNTQNAGSGKTLTPSGTVTDSNNGNNYNYSFIAGANGTINSAPLTYTANAATMTYGSAVPGLSGNVAGFVSGENQAGATTGTLTFTTSASSSSSVGSYPVNGSGLTANNGNYSFVQMAGNATALTINKLTANLTGSRDYDGTATAAAGILSVANKVGNDDVSVASGSGSLAGGSLGPQPITSLGTLTLGGITAGNYTLSGAGGSVTITTALLTVTNLMALDKVYDGTTNAALNATNAGLYGVVNGENVSLDASSAAGYFADANAGTNKPVTVTGLALGGGDAITNYVLTEPTNVTATIDPAPVTIASGIGADSKVYDGTTAATISSNDVVLNGMLSQDTNNIALSTNGYMATFATANVGTNIAVTISNLSLTGTTAGNYTVVPPVGLAADILPLVTPILNAISMESGTVQIGFNGQLGQKYRVLATDDLTLPLNQWTVTASGTFGSNPVTFTDSSTLPHRFYRIVSP